MRREKDGHLLEPNEDIKYTTCYMCACRCGIKVTIKDGKIRYIQGNPSHPTNQGVICAKGSSGVMKQLSPARITKPLKRKEEAERGDAEFDEITWGEAMDILVKRLKKIRSEDPKKLAFFTGRDQMQALTSYWAKQFGTPNFAAHGGFCSVNMATGMIYSIGGSSWEFGGADYERTKYMLLFGVAEDHDSNPMKLGMGRLREHNGKLVVINPVRSGYGAIADEWVPIRPGTDGAFILAMIHVLLKNGLYDRDFLTTRTNAAYLIQVDEGDENEGMPYLIPEREMKETQNTVWDRKTNSIREAHLKDNDTALVGIFKSPEGKTLKPAMQLLIERVMEEYSPEKASAICGVPADQIERIALEIGITARDNTIELPIPWIDAWGREHKTTTGNPVSIHAMRGIAAHSNGFQTIRALSVLMMILGIIDRPGGFRYKPPFPRPIPPCPKPVNSPDQIKPNTPLPAPELGFPSMPEHLMVDEEGKPIRIDKAFSWEFPFTAHGMMQNVITNAYKGDPYHIDALLLFMTNMAWNSTMNTSGVMEMLKAKDENGNYRIPFLVVSDAFFSEQVAFADLVLPDTTYLERHDVISMLDRPISDYSHPADAIRYPVLEPKGECRPFQQTLIDLANALGLPGFCDENGKPIFKTYREFITGWQPSPNANVGFLAGWRGKDGTKHLVGEPNPNQWEMYIKNKSFWEIELEDSIKYNRTINQGYLNWAQNMKLKRDNEPIIMHFYSEVMQRFRLAAKGLRKGRQPKTEAQRQRILKYFDPLPFWYFWYESIEHLQTDQYKYKFYAITQRPMPMYHSWDSQNAWLRQIIGQNYLYMNGDRARELGINDLDWVWVESPTGGLPVNIIYSASVSALIFSATGMVASMTHLGNPRRGWKAVNRWQSSWLSREAIFMGVFAGSAFLYLASLFSGLSDTIRLLLAISGIFAAYGLYISSAMLYAGIKFIREWSNAFTVANFVLFGLTSGGGVFLPLLRLNNADAAIIDAVTCILLFLGCISLISKALTCRFNATSYMPWNVKHALSINDPNIKLMSTGTSYDHYNTTEYSCPITQRQGMVQQIAVFGVFILPLLLWTATILNPEGANTVLCFIAAMVMITGLIIERRLFFIQGNHMQNLYYERFRYNKASNPALSKAKKV